MMKINKTITRLMVPGLSVVLFIAIFVLCMGFGTRMMNMDGDLGRHLTVGKVIVDNRSIPTTDLFSYTKIGQPFIPHEWLAEVLFYIAFALFKLDGVIYLSSVLISLSFSIVFCHAVHMNKSILVPLFLTLVGVAGSTIHWLSRPHLFSFLLTAIWFVLLQRQRNGLKGNGWWLSLAMVLWVNLHGAFVIGITLFMIIFVCDFVESIIKGEVRARKRIWINWGVSAGLILIATCINPVGWRIWETPVSFWSSSYLVSGTVEYRSPDFHQLSMFPFLLSILILIGSTFLSSTKKDFANFIVLLFWLAMGLVSARNIPIFSLLLIPIITKETFNLPGKVPRIQKLDRFLWDMEMKSGGILTGGILIVFLMLIQKSGGLFPGRYAFVEPVFPIKAIQFAQAQKIKGNGFNYFPWGGYILYSTFPENRVFIDGQTDFYGEKLTREYLEILEGGDQWEQLLSKYPTDFILIPPDTGLFSVATESQKWRNVYQDSTAVILVPNQ